MAASMSPVSIKRSLAIFALVAVASISPSSALFNHARGKLVDTAFELWTPEKLMQDLSEGYQPKWADYYGEEFGPPHEISGIVYSWLSRIQDKKRPKTIFNKYSVQDLLDLNLVYDKEATMEEYERRRQMCKEFSPGEVDEKAWRKESRFARLDEAKLLNQKYFLSQYCERTLRVFRLAFMENLEEQVKGKLSKQDNVNFEQFRNSLSNLIAQQHDRPNLAGIFEELLTTLDRRVLAELKTSCLNLEHLADTYRLEEFKDTDSGEMLGYCKHITTLVY